MNRSLPSLAALLFVVVGCAHEAPQRAAPVEAHGLGPGMESLAPLLEQASPRASAMSAWEPNFLYPPLGPRAVVLRHDHGHGPLEEAREAGALAKDMRAAGPGRAAMYLMFRAYQASYSRVDGSRCTMVPTCSRFGAEAVAAQGLWGVALTFGRLIRNHVRGEGFYQRVEGTLTYRDPVDNYTFWATAPSTAEHPFIRWHDDPAKGWFQHLRLADGLDHPPPPAVEP